MHSAPSVNFPVGRSRDASRLLGTIWAAGACCAGAASHPLDGIGWRTAVLWAGVLLCGGLAWWAHRQQPVGELRFDGQVWRLTGRAGDIHGVRPVPALDLQSLLLVRLVEPGRHSRWLWLERRSAPARWLDLRRAVYSRAPSADPADPATASRRSAGDSPSLS